MGNVLWLSHNTGIGLCPSIVSAKEIDDDVQGGPLHLGDQPGSLRQQRRVHVEGGLLVLARQFEGRDRLGGQAFEERRHPNPACLAGQVGDGDGQQRIGLRVEQVVDASGQRLHMQFRLHSHFGRLGAEQHWAVRGDGEVCGTAGSGAAGCFCLWMRSRSAAASSANNFWSADGSGWE